MRGRGSGHGAGGSQSQVEAELRRLLADKADEVAASRDMPSELLGRVRLRRAATAFGGGLAVVAVGLGAIGASAYLSSTPTLAPGAAGSADEGRGGAGSVLLEPAITRKVAGKHWILTASPSGEALCAVIRSGEETRRQCGLRLRPGHAVEVKPERELDGKTPVMGVASVRVQTVEVRASDGSVAIAKLQPVRGLGAKAYLGFLPSGSQGEVVAIDRGGMILDRESTLRPGRLPRIGCGGKRGGAGCARAKVTEGR